MIKTRTLYAILALTVTIAAGTPLLLGLYYAPVGAGPDEISHIDSAFFRLTRPEQPIDVEQGLFSPGYAPLGQGHQPSLYYTLLSGLLSLYHEPDDVGAFVDYQAGLRYSSAGFPFGGTNSCAYTEDTSRQEPETIKFQRSIKAMRALNAVFYALSAICIFIMGRLLFPMRPLLALSMTFLYCAIPTAIWRSVYINNDNLVSMLGTLVFLAGIFTLIKGSPIYFRLITLMCILSAASFLAKYNGSIAFGITLSVILLTPSQTFLSKIKTMFFALILFTTFIAVDLWNNVVVDGDIFSSAVVAHVVPALYQPSSVWTILTNEHFVPTIITRFWINFYNIGRTANNFPSWVIDIWWWLLATSLLGLILGVVIRPKQSLCSKRVIALSIMSILGALVFMIYFGAKFPLPGGRYIHIIAPAFAILIVTGLVNLLQILFKTHERTDIVLSISFCCLMLFGHTLTSFFFGWRYGACRQADVNSVNAGTEAFAGDIDGDGKDEIFLFHRIRNRIFVADKSSGNFLIQPQWTRSVRLVADTLSTKDINGDGLADLLLWRPSVGQWFAASGFSLTHHDKTLSQHSDLSSPITKLNVDSQPGDIPLSGDINGDGKNDLVLYRPTRSLWIANSGPFLKKPSQNDISKQNMNIIRRHFGERHSRPFLLYYKTKSLIGTYDVKTGDLDLSDMTLLKKKEHLTLPSNKLLLTIDADGNQIDDFLTWELGDSCLSLHMTHSNLFNSKSSSPKALKAQKICLPPNSNTSVFDRHKHLFALSLGNKEPQKLAVFNYIDGLVTIFEIGTNGSKSLGLQKVETFNPGWSQNTTTSANKTPIPDRFHAPT